MTAVAIIDSGICNLTSVRNAFDFLGLPNEAVSTPEELERFSHLVLPGVGAFAAGMERLRSRGLDEAIRLQAGEGKPLLGLCLGMQMLAEGGEEFGPSEGLGLVPGRVVRLRPRDASLRLPHVGWNDVRFPRESRLFRGLEEGVSFYFLHSFGYEREGVGEHVTALCDYGGDVVAAVERGNTFGVQFHPEKSQQAGLALLRNFGALC